MGIDAFKHNRIYMIYQGITILLIILMGILLYLNHLDSTNVVSSSLTTYTQLTDQRTKRTNRKIDRVIIHHTAGDFTLEELGDLFSQRDRQSSATYTIDKEGNIGQYVSESDEPWTSGSRSADRNAITIELVDNTNTEPWTCTKETYNTLVKLMKDIAKRYNIQEWVLGQNVFVHKDFDKNIECPGGDVMRHLPEVIDKANRKE